MRIATWNVNSLKARLEKVEWWLDRAAPDVLLMQETKLADAEAPVMAFSMAGYQLVHHGEGRWNGVAIASRCGLANVVKNFGEPLPRAGAGELHDDEPQAEARMIAALCGSLRVVCLYAPNGRAVGSPFYAAKLAWYARLLRWLEVELTFTIRPATPCATMRRAMAWVVRNTPFRLVSRTASHSSSAMSRKGVTG